MNSLPALIENVQRQVVIYRRLVELTRAQIAALKVQDVRTVHTTLQDIEITMLERSMIDRQRTECIRRVSEEIGIAIEDVTASRVADAAGGEQGNVLRMASKQLRDVVHELDSVVEVSRRLLQSELTVIDTLVKGMTRSSRPNSLYLRGGVQEYDVRIKLLDAQV